MRMIFAFLLLILSTDVSAQQDSVYVQTEVVVPETITDSVDVPVRTNAHFDKGLRAFRNYIAENFNFHNVNIEELNLDPQQAYYTVYLLFDIDENGNPQNFKPVNSTEENSVYKEAVRVVKSSRWVPATQNGKPISQTFSVPVSVYVEDLLGK